MVSNPYRSGLEGKLAHVKPPVVSNALKTKPNGAQPRKTSLPFTPLPVVGIQPERQIRQQQDEERKQAELRRQELLRQQQEEQVRQRELAEQLRLVELERQRAESELRRQEEERRRAEIRRREEELQIRQQQEQELQRVKSSFSENFDSNDQKDSEARKPQIRFKIDPNFTLDNVTAMLNNFPDLNLYIRKRQLELEIMERLGINPELLPRIIELRRFANLPEVPSDQLDLRTIREGLEVLKHLLKTRGDARVTQIIEWVRTGKR